MLDGHIHIGDSNASKPEFLSSLNAAGFEGGLIISPAPTSFPHSDGPTDWKYRLDIVDDFCKDNANLFPFVWIDPLEEDIEEQITNASGRVAGYKVICNRFYPSNEKAMKAYRLIASLNKPILFHSGILYDGMDSARYNRPGEFECLLEVADLRFALAHVSWPWCDECIAVYGKFQNAYNLRPDVSSEMFIDLTPGTPPIYRKEVLTKIFTVGYDLVNNVIFGSDGSVGSYGAEWIGQWVARDKAIYSDLMITEDIIDKIFGSNLRRFLGR